MKRISWIDVAKGGAIILMVAGHSSLPQVIQGWIYAFHMPLFFFLSGLTTNWSKGSILTFILKKTISLGRPFIFYSLLCLLLVYSLDLGKLSWARGWGDFALWFVPVLYVGLIVAKVILSLSCRISKVAIVLLLPLISGMLCYYNIKLPWNMSTMPYAVFFIIIGGMVSHWEHKLREIQLLSTIIALFVTFIISGYWHLSMSQNQCLPLIPLTIGAFAGIISFYSLSFIVDQKYNWLSKILQIVGRETFVILAFSQVIIMILNKYFNLYNGIKYMILVIVLIAIKFIKDILFHSYNCFVNK